MRQFLKSLFVAMLVFGVSTTFAQNVQNTQSFNYQGEASVAYGFPVIEGFSGMVSLETIHGIRVNPNIFVGGGLGLSMLNSDDSGDSLGFMIPLFVDVKWYVLDKDISPYLSVDMGYNWCFNGDLPDNTSGLYFAYGAGVSFKRKDNGSFNLGLALKNNGMYASEGLNASIVSLAIKAAIVF